MKEKEILSKRMIFLKEISTKMPKTSGCYLMKDENGNVLYVGKAKVLKNRVRSYFLKNISPKVSKLMSKVFNIDFVVTNTEYEALLLENNLIKKYHPFYNINLKDGKTYPVIRITHERFPRIFRTRHIIMDGSSYYGPYVNLEQMDIALEAINRLYPLRKCKEVPLKKRKQPCLFYHLKRCCGPCIKDVSEEYDCYMKEVKDFLRGNVKNFKRIMTQRMWKAAENLDFEKAQLINKILASLDSFKISQDVDNLSQSSADYIALVEDDEESCLAIIQVREGKMIGRDLFFFKTFSTKEESFEEFISQYYERKERIPKEIHISYELSQDSLKMIQENLKEKSSRSINILTPRAGHHMRLLRIAVENARLSLNMKYKEKESLNELQEILGLPLKPVRIDGIDIAHIDGKYPVGVVVSFWEGKPDKSHYRLYNLRSLEGKIDDYKAIKEVIARHYSKSQVLPDLLLIDGGKGQLSSALQVMQEMGLSFSLCSLAKKREEIFLPKKANSLLLPKGNRALAVLQNVRDEAHRFSTKQNRKLMTKRLKVLEINKISGVGPQRTKAIIQAFPSMADLLQASVEDLKNKANIPEKLSKTIVHWLKENILLTKEEPNLGENFKVEVSEDHF